MTMILTLKPAIKSDYLRGGPLQLKELQTRSPLDKWLKAVQPADKFTIEKVVTSKGNFTQIKLAEPIAGEKYWWVWQPSFNFPSNDEKGLPAKVKLPMTYLSQLDNENHPYGTCNLTSLAMTMIFYGHPRFDAAGRQLEDQLYFLCENKGLDRHVHEHLQEIITGFGYKDDYQTNAKWVDVKRHLAGGNPCICAGWFSRSGHILVISGYNESGFIVQDPFGCWYYQEDGNHYYDTSASGANLTYPYHELVAACGPDGDLWMHYISK